MVKKSPIQKMKRKSTTMRFLDQLIGEPMTFGSLLESTRLSENFSKVDFAKLLGISVSLLSDIEKGRKSVSAERAAHFARVLGYSEKQYIRLALRAI